MIACDYAVVVVPIPKRWHILSCLLLIEHDNVTFMESGASFHRMKRKELAKEPKASEGKKVKRESESDPLIAPYLRSQPQFRQSMPVAHILLRISSSFPRFQFSILLLLLLLAVECTFHAAMPASIHIIDKSESTSDLLSPT
jgi:hypothetical protein